MRNLFGKCNFPKKPKSLMLHFVHVDVEFKLDNCRLHKWTNNVSYMDSSRPGQNVREAVYQLVHTDLLINYMFN